MFKLPNLLIVGAQKSGTTWTHFMLSEVNNVYASRPKELNFFNQHDCRDESAIRKYMEHFPECGARWYLESTPHYFRLPIGKLDIAANINYVIGAKEKRLIVILRNPIERAISATIHQMIQGRLEYREVIERIYTDHAIVDLGFYARILRHWKIVFGEQLGVFVYDDIEAGAFSFLKSVLSFIGIDEDVTRLSLDRRINETSKFARRRGKIFVPDCDREIIVDLKKLYEEDIEKLFESTGRYFPDWLDIDKVCLRVRRLGPGG